MGQALYRKYRSKSLSEIVGQEHITDTLTQALKTGRISHAYLFTGPRGVGKTSVARILAHEINGLPYDDDSAHIDIIEIDAASNRRIDEIRELREKVYIAPTSAKYKVYIIDEVHMLTREAFNALLKTLEEPPAHVVFILATTDAHKLPETIISRTQRFTFRPGEPGDVAAHLKEIAKQEKIKISDDAVALLAEHGDGSFRDSVSLLDQAGNQGDKVELTDVQRLLGIPPVSSINELISLLANSGTTVAQLVQHLQSLFQQGFPAAAVAKLLAAQLRTQLIDSSAVLAPATTVTLLGELLQVAAAFDSERFLELLLLRTLSTSNDTAPQAKPMSQTVAVVKDKPAEATLEPPEDLSEIEEIAEAEPEIEEIVVAEVIEPVIVEGESTTTESILDESNWPQVLGALKAQYNTLYGIARMAQPDFSEPGTLTLTFAFAFHQKRINEAKNRQILADTIKQVTGQNVAIECIFDKDVTVKPVKPAAVIEPAEDLSVINAIFGGGEPV
jgi:DNA polymerase-3 subunit gamma/tau